MNAKEIMSREVFSVTPDHNIRHAIRIMLDKKVSGLAVVDDLGALVGIITEGDLLRRAEIHSGHPRPSLPNRPISADEAVDYSKSHSWRVSDVMTAEPITIDETATLNDMAEIMQSRSIKRLPVLKEGQLVGMVSRSDLMEAILKVGTDKTATGDDAIRLAVLTRIESDLGLTRNEVEVFCDRGHVRLSGVVTQEALLEAARVAAESVRGVASVANELWVKE